MITEVLNDANIIVEPEEELQHSTRLLIFSVLTLRPSNPTLVSTKKAETIKLVSFIFIALLLSQICVVICGQKPITVLSSISFLFYLIQVILFFISTVILSFINSKVTGCVWNKREYSIFLGSTIWLVIARFVMALLSLGGVKLFSFIGHLVMLGFLYLSVKYIHDIYGKCINQDEHNMEIGYIMFLFLDYFILMFLVMLNYNFVVSS
ncbi:hypothetical protein PAEPH01_1283 [Pancytospora epiphaga]|nr:hypothetical protein PAEPH01_1283 [Pancytospora epiphaga]